MKKYIKTKSGEVFKTRKWFLEEYADEREVPVYAHEAVPVKNIVKEDNDLEKLCDIRISPEEGETYLANWSKKGLVYVAKLENGTWRII